MTVYELYYCVPNHEDEAFTPHMFNVSDFTALSFAPYLDKFLSRDFIEQLINLYYYITHISFSKEQTLLIRQVYWLHLI